MKESEKKKLFIWNMNCVYVKMYRAADFRRLDDETEVGSLPGQNASASTATIIFIRRRDMELTKI